MKSANRNTIFLAAEAVLIKAAFSARQGFAPSVQGAPAAVAGFVRKLKGVPYMTERPPPINKVKS